MIGWKRARKRIMTMRMKVRIANVLYPVRDRYSASCLISPHSDYTGYIIPRLPWLSDDWFCLKEDNGNVRILFKDNIICGWTDNRPANNSSNANVSSAPVYVTIPRGDKRYTVSLEHDGNLSCNCTGWSYRKHCSHIQEVMEAA